MKRLVCLTVLFIMLICCAAAGSEEKMAFVFEDSIPQEYLKQEENGGRVEAVEYASRDYLAGDGSETVKKALVYLPEGYSAENRYDVLILCHGIGGDEHEWGFSKPDSEGKNILDNLIRKGEARPMIVVMPNGRSTVRFTDKSMNNMQSFYVFGQELRNDLLPWIDAHYATYGSDTPGDLKASRNHRFMAGLSMGGMQTINIGLCECPDLFSAFGAFSAAPTTYTADEINARLKQFPDEEIRYFYSLCGLQDNLYFAGSGAAKELPAHCGRFTEENWHWQERAGGHDFNIWYLGLYNFARLLGTLE